MSGQPAVNGAASPRLLVVGDGSTAEVFEVIELSGALVRARSAYLFEIGEELRVRIERDGTVVEANARVRGHVGSGAEVITELELSDQSEPRRVVTG